MKRRLKFLLIFMVVLATVPGTNADDTVALEVEDSNFELVTDEFGSLRLEITDLEISENEITTGTHWDYRAMEPGDAHFGSITIRARVGTDPAELLFWSEAAIGRELEASVDQIDKEGGFRLTLEGEVSFRLTDETGEDRGEGVGVISGEATVRAPEPEQ